MEANNYADGFSKAFEKVREYSNNADENFSALIVLPWLNCSTFYWCQCYDDQAEERPRKFKSYVNDIYQQFNRKLPIFYLDKEENDEAKKWVFTSNKHMDLITDYEMVNGFEHDVVIIIQRQDSNTFEHNLVMRSMVIPIIVKLPWYQWRDKCFGKCNRGARL